MIKPVIILLFISLNIVVRAQLASWPLTTNGNPTNVNANVIAGVFKNGTGLNTLSFGSSGASCSGWTTNNMPDTADYFQITIAPQAGYKLKINTIAFSERRSLTGIREYQVRISTTPDFSTYTTLTTVSVPDDDLERDGTITGLNIIVNNGETLYIRWYGYLAEGGTGTWRINDNSLYVGGTVLAVNPNDNDSYASDPQNQINSDTITASRNSFGLAKHVFSFLINDAGSSDGLPTDVSTVVINNMTSANWQSVIKGAYLKVNGQTINASSTISQSTINFNISQGNLIIPNGSSAEVQLYIYLKDSLLVEGTTLQFMVNNTSFDAYNTGSGFTTNAYTVTSNIFTIEVVATKVLFVNQPDIVFPDIPFYVKLQIVDNNNNLDLNSTDSIRITLTTGSGQLNSVSGLIKQVSNGTVEWNDLTYNTSGIFQLYATDQLNTLMGAYSNFIYSIIPPSSINEQFSDGDFTQNPVWVGSTGDFIVSSQYQLELNTVAASSENYSYLSTPIKLSNDSIEWQALINLNFSPSNNNNVKYYLMANKSNLIDTTSFRGYYIKIGEDGSSDAIKFYYQEGSVSTLLSTASLGSVASNPKVRIKVIRTQLATWRIYADYIGGNSFLLENVVNEPTYWDSIAYMGVVCKYTTTYASNKFFFDDFYFGQVQIDTIRPTLLELSVLDSIHIDLLFTEGINISDAENVTNYVVNNGIGIPLLATSDNLNPALIHLTFATPFVSGVTYTIAFFNLRDFAGNMIPQPLAENFLWYYVQPFDIVINEIMADPSPSVQLPEYEYVELYNRSPFTIQLKDWKFTIGSTTSVLPSYNLESGKYVILCHSSAVNALSSYGQVLPVIQSTTALTNSGTSLLLQTPDNRTIHYVNYSSDWYRSSYKDDGGWSLEQIDPNNPCGEENNWIASNDVKGGTPGTKNSVYKSNPDNSFPDLLRAILIEPDTLIVTFSEYLFGDSILNISNYYVNKGIGNPDHAYFLNSEKKKIVLIFNNANFVKDTIYTLTVKAGISDCVGNKTNKDLEAYFGIGDSIIPGSFVINEVLFYEPTGGNDYVELYNPTQHIYNLKDAKWADLNVITNEIDNLYELTSEGFYLFPNDYVVLTKSIKGVISFYSTPYPKKILEVPSMPSLNSTSGRISFVNKSFQIIDDFKYSENMQFQLLNSFKGVALERIHPELPTQDEKNWHSASESCGFGTPTYKNSQYAHFQQNTAEISIEPEVFSPDIDGKDDVLSIRYKFDEPGYVANITIFDARGREVRRLIRNEMCGTEGYFVWDGLTDAKTKADIGIYIIYIEVFNLNGTKQAFKKTCVVGGYLR